MFEGVGFMSSQICRSFNGIGWISERIANPAGIYQWLNRQVVYGTKHLTQICRVEASYSEDILDVRKN